MGHAGPSRSHGLRSSCHTRNSVVVVVFVPAECLFNTKLAECLSSAKPAGVCSTQNLQSVCSAPPESLLRKTLAGSWDVRRPFIELGTRPPGVIAASPDGHFRFGSAKCRGRNGQSWSALGRLVVWECKKSRGVCPVGLQAVMSRARRASVVCSWWIGGLRCKDSQGVCLVALRSV